MKYTSNYNLKKPDGTDLVNINDLNENMDVLDTEVAKKVDKVTGKGLSTEDFTTAEKNKLAGIATGANNYVHPSTHPPSIIAQNTSNRFVTDTEKATWNAKETPAGAQAKVNTHASNVSNPHSVTKSQVGLGSVSNYGVATQAQAEAGTANNVYMTPLRVKQAIDTFAGGALIPPGMEVSPLYGGYYVTGFAGTTENDDFYFYCSFDPYDKTKAIVIEQSYSPTNFKFYRVDLKTRSKQLFHEDVGPIHEPNLKHFLPLSNGNFMYQRASKGSEYGSDTCVCIDREGNIIWKREDYGDVYGIYEKFHRIYIATEFYLEVYNYNGTSIGWGATDMGSGLYPTILKVDDHGYAYVIHPYSNTAKKYNSMGSLLQTISLAAPIMDVAITAKRLYIFYGDTHSIGSISINASTSFHSRWYQVGIGGEFYGDSALEFKIKIIKSYDYDKLFYVDHLGNGSYELQPLDWNLNRVGSPSVYHNSEWSELYGGNSTAYNPEDGSIAHVYNDYDSDLICPAHITGFLIN